MSYIVSEISITYVNEVPLSKRIKISKPSDVDKVIRNAYKSRKIGIGYREAAFAIYLNRANSILAVSLISLGGISGTVVDIRILAQEALKLNASSVILFHNHPSGSVNPSETDLIMTAKVYKGLRLLDIVLVDHIIVTEKESYSMAKNSELNLEMGNKTT